MAWRFELDQGAGSWAAGVMGRTGGRSHRQPLTPARGVSFRLGGVSVRGTVLARLRGTRSAARGPRLGRRIHDEDQLHAPRALAARYRLSDGLADRLAGMDPRTDAVVKV